MKYYLLRVSLPIFLLLGLFTTLGVQAQYVQPASMGCVATPDIVQREGWRVLYRVRANGLEIHDVSYYGTLVLKSAKVTGWHQDYGITGYQDSTGCTGGGGGFLIFPYGNTQLFDIPGGFELVQDFRTHTWPNGCSDRYEQHFQFFNDGRYRVVVGSYGQGCFGKELIYRVLIRIDLAAGGTATKDSLAYWDGNSWVNQPTERRWNPGTNTSPDGYAWWLTDQDGGLSYYIQPGRGQLGGLGDNEFLYAVQFKTDEGDEDIGVFEAGCCNDNYHGPEIFVDDETIVDQNIVLWYVPQFQQDSTPPDYYCWTELGGPVPATHPCLGGPMFVPDSRTVTAGFTHNGPLELGLAAVFENRSIGAGPHNYLWDFGDGTISEGEHSPNHYYLAPGTYTVTLTVSNDISIDSFSDTMVILGVLPTATVVASSPIPTTPSPSATIRPPDTATAISSTATSTKVVPPTGTPQATELPTSVPSSSPHPSIHQLYLPLLEQNSGQE